MPDRDVQILGRIENQYILKVRRLEQINYVVCEDYEKTGSYYPEKGKYFKTFEDATNFIYKRKFSRLYIITCFYLVEEKNPKHNKKYESLFSIIINGRRAVRRYIYQNNKNLKKNTLEKIETALRDYGEVSFYSKTKTKDWYYQITPYILETTISKTTMQQRN